MMQRKAYAWTNDAGKFCLSALPASVTKRPFNVYDTQQDLLTEVGRRDMQVEWENGGV